MVGLFWRQTKSIKFFHFSVHPFWDFQQSPSRTLLTSESLYWDNGYDFCLWCVQICSEKVTGNTKGLILTTVAAGDVWFHFHSGHSGSEEGLQVWYVHEPALLFKLSTQLMSRLTDVDVRYKALVHVQWSLSDTSSLKALKHSTSNNSTDEYEWILNYFWI